MKYQNPVLRGFYPDPSVCCANGTYYLVCSSFQYFPGVPLFESHDLVNWKQIGHVLTRKSQVMLEGINSSGGVFAPTIRYHDGTFYMVTNNNTTNQNFYVTTQDIYGEWSEPIVVDQDGIDPSLYFEQGHTYFMSNGVDEHGINGVVQCEIDVATGEKLCPTKMLWCGSGGRYLESPHLYKIGDWYYVMAAEGGTEYGHMVTYARSKNLWGPYENYPHNPVLTNRNKAPYRIQGIGHGDLIQEDSGEWYIITLGFRQIHKWQPFHTLGREVFLTPVTFDADGWFTAGTDGTTDEYYEKPGAAPQEIRTKYTFETTDWTKDWCYLRHPDLKNYELASDKLILHGCEKTLNDTASPTFLGLRQREFAFTLSVDITIDTGEAGLCFYMCENEHYEIALRKGTAGYEVVLLLNIGGIHHEQNIVPVMDNKIKLLVKSDNLQYHFYTVEEGKQCLLGSGYTKYLSSEVSSGFTGVVMGLYAIGKNTAEFTNFICEYQPEKTLD